MSDGVLQLLPPHGLDQSILTAVLVGMLVLLFMTEWLGWVFVGLVVPGYLASVFVIQPAAAITVVIESVITFVLVRAISDTVERTDAWSPFFGRDRFFLIVLVSVIVRQASQLWLLPLALTAIDDHFGTNIYAQQDFFSIGLVLVPLTANMFWKLDLRRGVVQIGVPVVVTYALLHFVLLPHTNLSFSLLELTYENVALDFLGSAKAYMILIVGAFIAARLNLLYGWDYNGILVPSLIGLTWFAPGTAVSTLIEAVVLYVIASGVLSLPIWRRVNLEGPRKLVLVFTLGFLLKVAIGWLAAVVAPSWNPLSTFGFGYVLTSLIAVKMLTRRVVGRVAFPILAVSLAGFVVGSGVGFGLEQIAPAATVAKAPPGDAPASTMLFREPLGVVLIGEVRARPTTPRRWKNGRSGTTLAIYARLWRGIDHWLASGDGEPPAEVARAADRLGLELVRMAGSRPRYALVDSEERLRYQIGWDTAVLVPGARGPVIEVPRPRREAPVAEAAAVLCDRLDCRAIIIAGLDGGSDGRTAADALSHPRATSMVAHLRLRSAAVLQLRADRSMTVRGALLHLRHTLPPEIDLGRLRQLLPGGVDLAWARPPGELQQWDAQPAFAVLRASPDTYRELLAASAPPIATVAGTSAATRLDAALAGDAGAGDLQPRDPMTPISDSELGVIERLATGLLSAAGDARRLRWVGRLAATIDYEVAALPDCAGAGRPCWVLSERGGAPVHRWGGMAVRASDAAPLVYEVPHPRGEAGTLPLALALFELSNARALLAASAPPTRVRAGAEVNPVASPIQAMHQAAHRALAADGLLAEIRGFAPVRGLPDDLVVGLGAPVLESRQVPRRLRVLVAAGGPVGRVIRGYHYADASSDEIVALAGQGNPQLAFAQQVGGARVALLWFAAAVRDRFRAGAATDAAARPAVAASVADDLPEAALWLTDAQLAPPPAGAEDPLAALAPLVRRAGEYARTENPYALSALVDAVHRTRGARVASGFSPRAGLSYLGVELARGSAIVRAAVLIGADGSCTPHRAGDDDLVASVARDLLGRCAAVMVVGARAPAAGGQR